MSEERWTIPVSWDWATAGDIARIVGGGTPSSKVEGNFAENGIPWITPADLTGYRGSHISRGRRDLSEQGFVGSGAQLIPAGSVLFSSRAPIGYCVIASNEVSTNQGFKTLVLDGDIDPGYIRHYLLSAKEYAESKASGTTFMELSGARVAELAIPIAPLPEQRRIVAKVDGLTARTARALKELDRIPTLIARYKQRLLALAFSGELTAGWRNLRPIAQDLEKLITVEMSVERSTRGIKGGGRNRSVPESDFPIPHVPAGWIWCNFEDCAWDLTVGHVGPMKERYKDEGIPFLRSLNVRANRIDLKNVVFIENNFHEELKKSSLKPGDLVVVRTGAPGTAAVIPDSIEVANCSDLVIARLIPSLNPHYAAYYMNSEFAKLKVRGMQVGVAQQHFNVGAMSQMPLPFAPPDEQAEIVRRIESAFGWLDRVAADQTAATRLLPKLDAAILAKAFQGKLVPQDPNDEPAAKLLERVKAEREKADAGPKRGRGRPRTQVIRPAFVDSDSEVFLPTIEVHKSTKPRKSAMTKSRQDDDVKDKPYLAGLLKSGRFSDAQSLFRAADLPVADFYKQLAWEIDEGHILDNAEELKAA